jgi:hypothetical protein
MNLVNSKRAKGKDGLLGQLCQDLQICAAQNSLTNHLGSMEKTFAMEARLLPCPKIFPLQIAGLTLLLESAVERVYYAHYQNGTCQQTCSSLWFLLGASKKSQVHTNETKQRIERLAVSL